MKEVFVLTNRHFVGAGSHFILQHFLMNGMVCIRVKVIILTGAIHFILVSVLSRVVCHRSSRDWILKMAHYSHFVFDFGWHRTLMIYRIVRLQGWR
jgi:cell division protein FtsX